MGSGTNITEKKKKKKNKVILCSVLGCRSKKKFHFPKDDSLRAKWLEAIQRDNFNANYRTHGICGAHFCSEDFVESSSEAYRTRLRRTAIPSIFSWNESEDVRTNLIDYQEESIACQEHHPSIGVNAPTVPINVPGTERIVLSESICDPKHSWSIQDDVSDGTVSSVQNSSGSDHSSYCLSSPSHKDNHEALDSELSLEEPSFDADFSSQEVESQDEQMNEDELICISNSFDVYEEVIPINPNTIDANVLETENNGISESHITSDENLSPESRYSHIKPSSSQSGSTRSVPKYSVEYSIDKPEQLLHCTGLENYDKFMLVLRSLGPAAYHLKYTRKLCKAPSIPDQLLLVLWKLRRNESDTTLAMHFETDRNTVGSIFITWIIFMSQQWSLIDLWPSRELVDLYMPDSFKTNFPKTRGILDGTEFEIERPTNPRHQQASFSQYKNRNTVKVGMIMTPGGLMSHKTKAYGGATRDRQLVERSDFLERCDSGDIIMADKGFCVQDIFAPYGVTCMIPNFVKKGCIPHAKIMRSRHLSKHRIHIERGIGLVKTFKILKSQLNHNYTSLASKIIGVCVMLSNFKENIMTPRLK